MSNTSEVTPYTNQGHGSSSSVRTDSGGVISACVSYLFEETPEDVQARTRYQQQKRDEMLASAKPVSIGLHLSNPRSLVQAAQSLGYSMAAKPSVPSHTAYSEPIFLFNPQGQKLVLHLEENHLVLSGNRGVSQVNAVVRQHSIQETDKLLEKGWTQIQSRRLPGGIMEIEAREINSGQAGGAATIKAEIDSKGEIKLDIDNIKGNRCEKILKEFTTAVGGKASSIKKKQAYWQNPGEPAKVKV
jgi:hypothetical protein